MPAKFPRKNAVHIVPLHKAVPAAVTAPPQLIYRGGPLMTAVEVFTVFWGAAWQQQATIIAEVNQFFDSILGSALITQMSEYSVAGQSIGYGKRTGTVTIPTKLKRSVSDTAIQNMLQQEIASGSTFPQPGPNTLYFVYLPPNVRVTLNGEASCQVFCGYHNDINEKLFYAVMPYPGCSGCEGPLSVIDAITSTSSHELCEAITDPIPGASWYDDVNSEIGDICAWQTKKVGSYTVQLEWSNSANKCV